MMLRNDMEHLPCPLRAELRRIMAMLFEAFAETCKGRASERYRVGSILKLILHGPHVHPEQAVVAGDAIHLTAIVGSDRLARRERDWLLVHDRSRRIMRGRMRFAPKHVERGPASFEDWLR